MFRRLSTIIADAPGNCVGEVAEEVLLRQVRMVRERQTGLCPTDKKAIIARDKEYVHRADFR